MRRIPIEVVSLAMLACLGSTVAFAQNADASLRLGAAQCLAAKKFLPPTNAKMLTFGYFLDEKSYPEERMLYVVDFPNPARRDGFVFTLFLSKEGGRDVFNIQNNARFAVSKNGIERITFLSPPLGGDWTQEHLASAIKKIENHPRFTIHADKLVVVDSSFRCKAYTDPQP